MTTHQLPTLTRFTFGTGNVGDKANREHMAVTRAAMDAGVWFHTSQGYGNGGVFETLHAAFKEDPAHTPRCIFKVDGMSPALLRETVEASLRGVGIDQVHIAQVCGNPHQDGLRPGGALREAMADLKDKGMVGSYSLEVFWPFSENLLPVLEFGLFDSVIFYYNVVEREVSNAFYDALEKARMPILALRTLGGGPANFGRPENGAQASLQALSERAGCTDPVEFRARFPISVPLVKTTIGATAKPDHLTQLLKTVEEAPLLPADIVQDVQELHRSWFSSRGL